MSAPPDAFDEIARTWAPSPIVRHDRVEAHAGAGLAALLDQPSPLRDVGDPLPPLWHWVMFPALHARSDLGADGHPRDGALTPPLPERRRMFGGGRLQVHAPLRLGDVVERREQVQSVRTTTGSTGPLLLVTVRQDLLVAGELRLSEEQDLIYRRAADVTAATGRAAPAAAEAVSDASEAPWRLDVVPDPVLLFRFSALTTNAHRIHYDQTYATQVEHHPGLVVHGPLLALLMLELPRRHRDNAIVEVSWRGRRPVHAHEQIVVTGTPNADGAELRAGTTEDPDRFTATVRFAGRVA